jgi:serine/threonine-protein kinase
MHDDRRQPPLLAGTEVHHYRIMRLIGRGGMADVYRACHAVTGEEVALKLLAPIYAVSVLEQRFQREAINAARLRHPGCVRVIEHGVAEDGTLFLSMELLTGRTLRSELNAAGKLAVGHAVRVIKELLDALAHAHGAGVLHRDIKPENVMFRRPQLPPPPVRIRRGAAPAVVLIDFGLSVLRDDARLTAIGTCMGSPSYLAPERLLEQSYDERADVYAVGVVLYELLAGAPPFSGTTPIEIARQHIERSPLAIDDLRPDVPQRLASIVHRALAKDPDDRFQSATEMLSEIRELPPIWTAPYPIPLLDLEALRARPSLPLIELGPHGHEATIPLSSRSITLILPPTLWRRAVRWVARLFRPRRYATGAY